MDFFPFFAPRPGVMQLPEKGHQTVPPLRERGREREADRWGGRERERERERHRDTETQRHSDTERRMIGRSR